MNRFQEIKFLYSLAMKLFDCLLQQQIILESEKEDKITLDKLIKIKEKYKL